MLMRGAQCFVNGKRLVCSIVKHLFYKELTILNTFLPIYNVTEHIPYSSPPPPTTPPPPGCVALGDNCYLSPYQCGLVFSMSVHLKALIDDHYRC